jgi:hypothetical protein
MPLAGRGDMGTYIMPTAHTPPPAAIIRVTYMPTPTLIPAALVTEVEEEVEEGVTAGTNSRTHLLTDRDTHTDTDKDVPGATAART